MGKMGNFSASDLKKLQKKLNQIQGKEVDAFVEACAKDLAARLLTEVIKRTPVGDYSIEKEVTAKRDSKNHKKGDVYKKRVNPTGKAGHSVEDGLLRVMKRQRAAKAGLLMKKYWNLQMG